MTLTEQQAEQIEAQPDRLRKLKAKDMAIRFGFGVAVSTVAGVISVVAGPRTGGVLLAFPAILLASLTLVAKEDGLKIARADARGATYGALGFIVFAVVCVVLAERVNTWVTLGLAGVAWLLVALAAYAVARRSATRRVGTRPPGSDAGESPSSGHPKGSNDEKEGNGHD